MIDTCVPSSTPQVLPDGVKMSWIGFNVFTKFFNEGQESVAGGVAGCTMVYEVDLLYIIKTAPETDDNPRHPVGVRLHASAW